MTPRLQVFARAPVPGECKTRMIPALGPGGAAALHENLVRHTLQTAHNWRARRPDGEVELWCAPDADHRFFADCAREFDVALKSQAQGDLGARMWLALMDGLASGSLPLLVGTDCPWLDPEALDSLLRAAARHDCAFIPAEDGGYVAVSLARAVPELFAAVDWGSERVMAQTRRRAARVGATLAEVGRLPDVDDPSDLQRLRADATLAHLVPPVSST